MYEMCKPAYGDIWRPYFTEPALLTTTDSAPGPWLSGGWIEDLVELNLTMQQICLRETGERWTRFAAWHLWLHMTPSAYKTNLKLPCTGEERAKLQRLSAEINGWSVRPILSEDLDALINSFMPMEQWRQAFVNLNQHKDYGLNYF